jgi:hypothetical protein
MTAEHQDALWHVLDEDDLSHGPDDQIVSENAAKLHKQLQGMLLKLAPVVIIEMDGPAFKTTCCIARSIVSAECMALITDTLFGKIHQLLCR